ncbi:MAG: DUF4091 domain-containing protein [Clostridia bacterium]|nr:DUF4091 domain-containing protein [Clostridia bacterium]
MIIKLLSSLEKVFSDKEPVCEERSAYSMFRNERLSFQLAFRADEDGEVKALVDEKYAPYISVFAVGDEPVVKAADESADDFFISKEPGNYPDILFPGNIINAKAGSWYSFWFEFAPVNLTGEQSIDISLGGVVKMLKVNIINAELPKQELIYTNWFHCDAICDYYGVEFFSDEFLRILRNFVRTASDHGMNCILTPLFTPALDTQVGGERTTTQLVGVKLNGNSYEFDLSRLKKWVEICLENGIEYFEMSHFFTQWGAEHSPKVMATDETGAEKRIFGWETETHSEEYNRFLTGLSVCLKAFIEENGLHDRVFFHISDEPGGDQLETYMYRASLIKKIFAGYPVIDALSDYEFYKNGAVDIPIPSENHIEEFAGRVEHFWTYYCSGQRNQYVPNRFIAMPSVRNRVFGVLAAKYDVEGFLQWGYNFYNSVLSKQKINPYETADALGGFEAGDSFVVYPGENGEVICSLRLKVIYDSFQDYRALKLLESLAGKEKSNALTGEITFKNYPHEASWLLDLRERINSEIQANLQSV